MATTQALGRLGAALRQIRDDLEAVGQRWALVGGLAVGARAEPRFTRDVDLAVSVPDDAAAERLIFQLQSLGYRPHALVEHEARHRVATVRLTREGEGPRGVVVDLLFASSGIEAEIVRAATPVDVLPGVIVPVARAGHLLALKVLSYDVLRRPQDLVDLNTLIESINTPELRRARAALALISKRGFNRKKALAKELSQLLRRLSRT